MKAFQIERYGAVADVLRLKNIDVPRFGANDVVVEVHAASINPVDLKYISGEMKMAFPLKFPHTLGYDISGVVSAIGNNVTMFKVGDEVYTGLEYGLGSGAFAEFAVIPQTHLAYKPRNCNHAKAASLPVAGLTALQAFTHIYKLQKGQKVLIHAGAGGVGTLAIQLAKHLGAIVATTASEAKKPLVSRLGADVIIDYTKENFRQIIKDYDLVLDTLGGQVLLDSLYCLKKGGTLISISGTPDNQFGKEIQISLPAKVAVRTALWFMNRSIYRLCNQLDVEYHYLFKKTEAEDLRTLAELVEQNVLEPVIDRVVPFAQVVEALEYLQTGRATGKVVLAMK